MIKPHADKERNLTTYLCSGPVTMDEIREQLLTFYGGRPTLNTIWDFSEADVSGLSRADIENIAKFVKTAAHSRDGGKTALVFPPDMLMDMGPLLVGISEIEVPEAKIKIHQDIQAALDWIREST
jgi:hypothetical protein